MEQIKAILQKYWGYSSLRPLQAEAMQAILAGQDSVVVLPTGGGKSLCFQAPAVRLPGLAIVVSPLISLMKDQVDALNGYGVPAACVNSSLSFEEKRDVAAAIRSERLKLLYIAPERLNAERTMDFLRGIRISFVAIDEAHCISSWGHDFRPDYRALRGLKKAFPGIGIHAYTATATEDVRTDIAAELGLDSPRILVGSFDRPNLIYRVQQRTDRLRQIRDVLERHVGESGIIYCVRRADVDELSADLTSLGFRALPYHAGMEDTERKNNQEAFIKERADLIVATVAFGMGIDKSNVRFVIHSGAPKSLENYQQESGRAGRDGLEAECCIFYSGGDFATWKKMQEDLEPAAREVAMATLDAMAGYCSGISCRHKTLVEYFGQEFATENCGACDVCLQELDLVEDPLIVAQKILSCVVRLQQNFGSDYTAQVLIGSREQRILDRGHEKLTTYGILGDRPKQHIRNWIEQLVSQGYLQKTGEYNVLQVTPTGRSVLKGELSPRLLKPAAKKRKTESKVVANAWEGVDRTLFETLRKLRRRLADQRGVSTWLVFSDKSLRDMARLKPLNSSQFLQVNGVGEKKNAEFGTAFLAAISEHENAGCPPPAIRTSLREPSPADNDVADREPDPDEPRNFDPGVDEPSFHEANFSDRSFSEPDFDTEEAPLPQGTKRQAFELFQKGRSVEQVAAAVGRARSTTYEYLTEFIEREQVSDSTAWLEEATFEEICEAAIQVGGDKLKPIFEKLEGKFSYEQIKVALACMRNAPPS